MIPGLGSAPSIWQSAIAAVPGYRYHLVQVKGFAGTAAEANASGPILEPVAKEIVRYLTAMELRRPRIIGHSMCGQLAMMLAARYPASSGEVVVVEDRERTRLHYRHYCASRLPIFVCNNTHLYNRIT